MFEIFVETHFSAAHHLADYQGNCARWHGHNWLVTAFVEAAALNELGLAVDFRRVKGALHTILERLDHTNLNEVPEFAGMNPTCEVIARSIFRQLAAELNDDNLTVTRVRVSETPSSGASYHE